MASGGPAWATVGPDVPRAAWAAGRGLSCRHRRTLLPELNGVLQCFETEESIDKVPRVVVLYRNMFLPEAHIER